MASEPERIVKDGKASFRETLKVPSDTIGGVKSPLRVLTQERRTDGTHAFFLSGCAVETRVGSSATNVEPCSEPDSFFEPVLKPVCRRKNSKYAEVRSAPVKSLKLRPLQQVRPGC